MITIRGATTVEQDEKELVLKETEIMLIKIIKENNILIKDISSVFFTATKDIKSAYPAISARNIGITEASLMCTQEMYVADSLNKCIRVMITCENNMKQSDVKHIYLNDAANLRPDLKND